MSCRDCKHYKKLLSPSKLGNGECHFMSISGYYRPVWPKDSCCFEQPQSVLDQSEKLTAKQAE